MINNLVNQVLLKIDYFNSWVEALIAHFLEAYYLPVEPEYFTARLPLFLKLLVYLLMALIPLSIMKLFLIGYRKFTYFLVLLVFLIFLVLAGIFFGFLQLLYA